MILPDVGYVSNHAWRSLSKLMANGRLTGCYDRTVCNRPIADISIGSALRPMSAVRDTHVDTRKRTSIPRRLMTAFGWEAVTLLCQTIGGSILVVHAFGGPIESISNLSRRSLFEHMAEDL